MKRKLLFFLLVLTIVIQRANAQYLQWAKQLGNTDQVQAWDVHVDVQNNSYVIGNFQGVVDFDPGIGTYNMTASTFPGDKFVLKLDPSGQFIWARQFNTGLFVGASSVLDDSANIILAISFSDTLDADPGLNTYNLDSTSDANLAVIKLDSAGDFIWAKQLAGVAGSQITVDQSAAIYLNGRFNGTVDFDPSLAMHNVTAQSFDLFVLKLSETGDFVWCRSFAPTISGYTYPYAIHYDRSGFIYTATEQEGDDKLIKLDSAGGHFWSKPLPATGDGGIEAIRTDPWGHVLILGSQGTGGNYDVFVHKADSAGDIIWTQQFGNAAVNLAGGLAVDNSGRSIFCGSFMSTLDLDPGNATFDLTSVNDMDVFIMALDSTGQFDMGKQLAGFDYQGASDLALDNLGNLIVVGQFKNTCDFDPDWGQYDLTSLNMDAFIAKYASTLAVSETTSSNTPDISIRPSPSTGTFTISSATAIDKLHLTDALGRELYTAQPHTTTSTHTVDLPSGLYYLTLHSGNTITTEKLVISK